MGQAETIKKLRKQLADAIAEVQSLRSNRDDGSLGHNDSTPSIAQRIETATQKYGGVLAVALGMAHSVLPETAPVRIATWSIIASLMAYPFAKEVRGVWHRVWLMGVLAVGVAVAAYVSWPGPPPDAPINREAMQQKYSLGYVLYEPDKPAEQVFPFNRGLLDKFNINLSEIRLQLIDRNRLQVHLPPILTDENVMLMGETTSEIPVVVNGEASGAATGGILMGAQIVAIRTGGVAVVVGFTDLSIPE